MQIMQRTSFLNTIVEEGGKKFRSGSAGEDICQNLPVTLNGAIRGWVRIDGKKRWLGWIEGPIA